MIISGEYPINIHEQSFQILNVNGSDKPFQRENLFEKLANYTKKTPITILGGDFNIVPELGETMVT